MNKENNKQVVAESLEDLAMGVLNEQRNGFIDQDEQEAYDVATIMVTFSDPALMENTNLLVAVFETKFGEAVYARPNGEWGIKVTTYREPAEQKTEEEFEEDIRKDLKSLCGFIPRLKAAKFNISFSRAS